MKIENYRIGMDKVIRRRRIVFLTGLIGLLVNGCDYEVEKSHKNTKSVDLPMIGKADGSLSFDGQLNCPLTTFNETLSNQEEYRLFRFDTQTEAKIRIELNATNDELDPMLGVFKITDEGGYKRFGTNDDCNEESLNSCLDLTLPENSEFIVIATR